MTQSEIFNWRKPAKTPEQEEEERVKKEKQAAYNAKKNAELRRRTARAKVPGQRRFQDF